MLTTDQILMDSAEQLVKYKYNSKGLSYTLAPDDRNVFVQLHKDAVVATASVVSYPNNTCEIIRFASVNSAAARLLLEEIATFLYIQGYDKTYIEVHPSHAFFYEATFGFQKTGQTYECERVGADAVLLCVTRGQYEQWVKKS